MPSDKCRRSVTYFPPPLFLHAMQNAILRPLYHHVTHGNLFVSSFPVLRCTSLVALNSLSSVVSTDVNFWKRKERKSRRTHTVTKSEQCEVGVKKTHRSRHTQTDVKHTLEPVCKWVALLGQLTQMSLSTSASFTVQQGLLL